MMKYQIRRLKYIADHRLYIMDEAFLSFCLGFMMFKLYRFYFML